MADRSIGGNWRGHYDYKRLPDEGSGFEALFVEGESGLTGHIIDDFAPGKATLVGAFAFPSVQFTKTYVVPGYAPIDYQGTMSDDGKSMSGTWEIVENDLVSRGSWTAYRLDDEEKKESAQAERATLIPVDGTR